MNDKVLFVDDETNVLQAYNRGLRKQFTVKTAEGGRLGLDALREEGPFAVVVSDMRMPEMDGVEFLSEVKGLYPNTVRVMLTGNADQKTAIDAVNKGDVFKFLNKPCPPEDMAKTLNAAIEQYRLINAEQVLLEQTVKGSIEALSEIMSLSNPEVFGRTTLYKTHMLGCAEALGLIDVWKYETMAMLSLLGLVAMPDELVEKAASGKSLSDEERKQYDSHALAGARLVGKIPRMEELAEAIKYQNKRFDGGGIPEDGPSGKDIPIGARLLKVIIDYDMLERLGIDSVIAIGKFQQSEGIYDPEVVEALAEVIKVDVAAQVREIGVTQLSEKMVLAEDIRTHDGTLLVCKGQQITASVGDRLMNFWHNGAINEKVMVLMFE